MAKWSQIPEDILHEIQSHLNSPFYTVRLRSICSNWRHVITSNGHNHPTPPPPFSLTKLTILLLSSPQTPNHENPNSWIIKINPNSPQKFHLFYPLSKIRVNPDTTRIPRWVNMNNIRIRELGHEYFGCYTNENDDVNIGFCSLYSDNVAFMLVGTKFMLLTIHVSGNLALFDSVGMKWCVSDGFESPYDDVIVYEGAFYAVDNVGRTVVVNMDDINSNVSLVAKPVCGGDKKRMVKMGGDLMLVDVYIGLPPLPDGDGNGNGNGGFVGYLDDFVSTRSMWFKVFRLDWGEQCWVEVKDLGNNVLFLGVRSTFSASADDLLCKKGNYIYFNFPDNISQLSGFEDGGDDHVKYHCGGVYDLDDASISYSKLFWPPPSWIESSS